MKIKFLLLTLIVFLFSPILVLAYFGNPGLSIKPTIGPLQQFEGFVNLSVRDLPSDAKLSFIISNSKTITQDFDIKKILDAQKIPYTCISPDCRTFSTLSSSDEAFIEFSSLTCKEFPCNLTTLGLVVKTSNRSSIGEVEVKSISFSISGASVGGSYAIPFLDIGADNNIEWRYFEPSDIFEKLYLNITNQKKGYKPLTSDWEYCEEYTLKPSKRFKFSVMNLEDVKDDTIITFIIRDSTNLSAIVSYNTPVILTSNNKGKAEFAFDFFLEEKKDFLVCVKLSEHSLSGGKIPYYDGSGKAYFYSLTNGKIHQDYDFWITAEYAKLKPFNFEIALNDESGKLREAIQSYLDQKCDPLAKECVVPIRIFSATPGKITFKNLIFSQNKWPPETSFYFIEEKPSNLSTKGEFVIFDLTDQPFLKFASPMPENYPNNYDKEWNLKVELLDGSGNLLDKTKVMEFLIEKVPVVYVKPLEGFVGLPIRFDASSSYSPANNELVRFEWDFGDGTTKVTSKPSVEHIYLGEGNYTLKLKITDDNNLSSTKSFPLKVFLSVDEAKNLIKLKLISLEIFKATLPQDYSEKRLILKLTNFDQIYETLLEMNSSLMNISLDENGKENELLNLISDITFMDIPKKIYTTKILSREIAPDVSVVDPSFLQNTAESSDLELIKNAIALWQQKNLKITLKAEVKEVDYGGKVDKFNLIRINLEPLNQMNEYYLVLYTPGKLLGTAKEYDVSEVEGALIFKLRNERQVVLATSYSDVLKINAFASPPLSELNLEIEKVTCGNNICEVEEGETAKTCPEDCGKGSNTLAIILIGLVLIGGILGIIIVWKSSHKPAFLKYFNSKKDYENLMGFVRKHILIKSKSELKSILLKAGWKPEQISFVMEKVSGEISNKEIRNIFKKSLFKKDMLGKTLKKRIPLGVKVISVVLYLLSFLSLIIGFSFVFFSNYLLSLIPPLQILANLLFLISIFFFLFSIVLFFVGNKLWEGKEWARLTAIILSSWGIIISFYLIFSKLYDLTYIISGMVTLLLLIFIVSYLLFNKDVKNHFQLGK